MDKSIKFSIIAGILIVSLSFVYYFVIFLPKKENAIIEIQRQDLLLKQQLDKKSQEKEVANKNELDACLQIVGNTFTSSWNDNCKNLGKKSECSLPIQTVQVLNDWLAQGRNNCYEKYSQK